MADVDGGQQQGAAPPGDGHGVDASGRHLSRRALLGHMAAGGATGAAVWVVPQILTAQPSAAGTLSGAPAGSGPQSVVPAPTTSAATSDPSGAPVTSTSTTGGQAPNSLSALADTGLDLPGQATAGAVMIAAGWTIHRWVSRAPSHPAVAPTQATHTRGAHAQPGPTTNQSGGAHARGAHAKRPPYGDGVAPPQP